VILRDVRLGNGYRVVEVRNVSSKNACYGQGRFTHVFPGWVRCDTSLNSA